MKTTIGPDGKPELHRFSMLDPLGGLPLSKCSAGDTTEMAKQIGIGPTLFLMSTKAYAIFFIFLTILNLPVFMFYSKGNPAYNKNQLIDSFFATLSLGNVGQKNEMCASENMAVPNNVLSSIDGFDYKLNDIMKYSKMTLKCNSGTLGDIKYFGLGTNVKSNCGVLIGKNAKPDEHLLPSCRNNGTKLPVTNETAIELPTPEKVKHYTGDLTLLNCYKDLLV